MNCGQIEREREREPKSHILNCFFFLRALQAHGQKSTKIESSSEPIYTHMIYHFLCAYIWHKSFAYSILLCASLQVGGQLHSSHEPKEKHKKKAHPKPTRLFDLRESRGRREEGVYHTLSYLMLLLIIASTKFSLSYKYVLSYLCIYNLYMFVP